MIEPTNKRVREAAELALSHAQEVCIAAQIDPTLHAELLVGFVIEDVRIAVAEVAHSKAHGGPTAAYMLTQAFYQRIFFCRRRSTGSPQPHKRDATATIIAPENCI